MQTTNTGAAGEEETSPFSVAMNGQTSSVTSQGDGRKFEWNLKWSTDKKSLTITMLIYKAGNSNEVELTRVETWSLLPGGKELVVDRKSIETVSEDWEVKGIFTKQ